MDDLVRVAKVSDFRFRRGRTVDFDGKKVAVFRTSEGWVAVSDACPHMGASLADGRGVDGKVECSWHHWKFDLRTGKSAWKDWACVTVYAVRVHVDEVFLERPAPDVPVSVPDGEAGTQGADGPKAGAHMPEHVLGPTKIAAAGT